MQIWVVLSAVTVFTLLSLDADAGDTKYILQFGIEGGGGILADTTTYDISAAGGLYLGGGFSFSPRGSSTAYEFTIGYLFDSVEYELPNGESTIDTLPFEFTVRKILGAHHLGGGITYHLDPELEQCIDVSGCDVYQFNSAVGFNLVYSYMFQKMFVAGKYTVMNYDYRGFAVDANSFGLYLGIKY